MFGALRWSDTYAEGPDGRIYVAASHIQDTSWFKPGALALIKTRPFSFAPATLKMCTGTSVAHAGTLPGRI